MTAPGAIVLRPASPDDAEFVFRVSEATMRAYAEATWGRWDPEQTKASFSPVTHRIIQRDGADIGCLEWIEQLDGFRLNKLFILPTYQNRGIGSEILDRPIDQARSALKPIRLSVLTVNPAQTFYALHGFYISDKTPERVFMIWTP